jgi:hypothetical protein
MDPCTRRLADSRLPPATVNNVCPPDSLHPEQEAGKEIPRYGEMQCATDLLVLLTTEDHVFDTVSSLTGSDQSSQLSMPFSDVAEDDCLSNVSAGHRTSVDGEVMAFSSEFKKALMESRDPASKLSGSPNFRFKSSHSCGRYYNVFPKKMGLGR